eukprot:363362-Chlamydomonas_euryale.AAC.22
MGGGCLELHVHLAEAAGWYGRLNRRWLKVVLGSSGWMGLVEIVGLRRWWKAEGVEVGEQKGKGGRVWKGGAKRGKWG